jgi:hypothetical protein
VKTPSLLRHWTLHYNGHGLLAKQPKSFQEYSLPAGLLPGIEISSHLLLGDFVMVVGQGDWMNMTDSFS